MTTPMNFLQRDDKCKHPTIHVMHQDRNNSVFIESWNSNVVQDVHSSGLRKLRRDRVQI